MVLTGELQMEITCPETRFFVLAWSEYLTKSTVRNLTLDQLVAVPHEVSYYTDLAIGPSIALTLQSDVVTLHYSDTSSVYGRLHPVASQILKVLQREPSISLQLYISACEPGPPTRASDKARSQRSRKRHTDRSLQVIIYGSRHLFNSIGTFLSGCRFADSKESTASTYLQQPQHCDRNVQYCNPHCLSPQTSHYVFTFDLEEPAQQSSTYVPSMYIAINFIDRFADVSASDMLGETESPSCLKTKLYRYGLASFSSSSKVLPSIVRITLVSAEWNSH